MTRLFLIAIASLLLPAIAVGQNPQRSPPVLSPEIQADGKVTFRLRAAQAKEANLRGQWTKEPLAMTRGADGMWCTTAEGVTAGLWEYGFQGDGVIVRDLDN